MAEMPLVVELQMLPWGTSIEGNQAPRVLSPQKGWGPACLSHSLLTGGSPGGSMTRKHHPGHNEWTYWASVHDKLQLQAKTRGGGKLSLPD